MVLLNVPLMKLWSAIIAVNDSLRLFYRDFIIAPKMGKYRQINPVCLYLYFGILFSEWGKEWGKSFLTSVFMRIVSLFIIFHHRFSSKKP